MSEYEDIALDDPFLTLVYDAAPTPLAVWRFDGEPDGPRYVVDAVAGVEMQAADWIGAGQAIPEGAPWALEIVGVVGVDDMAD
jgi:hypothetical protein